jgi:hypothetical protein
MMPAAAQIICSASAMAAPEIVWHDLGRRARRPSRPGVAIVCAALNWVNSGKALLDRVRAVYYKNHSMWSPAFKLCHPVGAYIQRQGDWLRLLTRNAIVAVASLIAACDAPQPLSCSSPQMIETLRAVGLDQAHTEFEIMNIGTLGRTGNVLNCSADFKVIETTAIMLRVGDQATRSYTILPLDDGKFRVSIVGWMTTFGLRTFDGVGPFSYREAKDKRAREEMLAARRDEVIRAMPGAHPLSVEKCLKLVESGGSEPCITSWKDEMRNKYENRNKR